MVEVARSSMCHTPCRQASFQLCILVKVCAWHFVIISSNGLAKQVFQSSHPLDRLAKWLAILREYDFSFKIVKGGCSNLKNALIDLGEIFK